VADEASGVLDEVGYSSVGVVQGVDEASAGVLELAEYAVETSGVLVDSVLYSTEVEASGVLVDSVAYALDEASGTVE